MFKHKASEEFDKVKAKNSNNKILKNMKLVGNDW